MRRFRLAQASAVVPEDCRAATVVPIVRAPHSGRGGGRAYAFKITLSAFGCLPTLAKGCSLPSSPFSPSSRASTSHLPRPRSHPLLRSPRSLSILLLHWVHLQRAPLCRLHYYCSLFQCSHSPNKPAPFACSISRPRTRNLEQSIPPARPTSTSQKLQDIAWFTVALV
ncbi:hypothetical protein T440DRAFT_31302 [Plenodomus tracheiphilus IPT5]|uniref:Uncharacterized protein n=1 Tax=Plenodomus tracheiphilus IPT5 TaxID=1408161 RepID=A0A6A7BEH1_9PLEO|nr:hypothetical protein T440DRAFT_31302 [Plenodomus tracheiphilus IPT5]